MWFNLFSDQYVITLPSRKNILLGQRFLPCRALKVSKRLLADRSYTTLLYPFTCSRHAAFHGLSTATSQGWSLWECWEGIRQKIFISPSHLLDSPSARGHRDVLCIYPSLALTIAMLIWLNSWSCPPPPRFFCVGLDPFAILLPASHTCGKKLDHSILRKAFTGNARKPTKASIII